MNEPSAGTNAKIAFALFATALALTIAVHVAHAADTYTYRHGFISAVFASSARNFATLGITHLGGVPMDNNPPISGIDAYIHWPPAFPLLLSFWFRLFGISETSAHLGMLAIQIGSAALVFAIATNWLGYLGGALSGFFWITMPAIVHYGHLVVPENLAVLLMLIATLGFIVRRRWLVAAAAFLGTCTSWEAALIPAGFWIVAISTKDRDDSAMARISTICMLAAIALVWGAYLWHNPVLFRDAIQSGLFRMGVSHSYSAGGLVNAQERYMSFEESVGRICVNFPRMLGVASAALVLLAINRPPKSTVILCGLGFPWLAWCILMRNHVAAHDMEMLLAAPAAAIALAWSAMGFLQNSGSLAKGILAWCVAIVIVVAQPWIFGTEKSPEDPRQIMGFSATIKRETPPTAIILSSLVSAVPLYYSERHIIRYVTNREMAARIAQPIRQLYPGSRLYWVTPLYEKPWATIQEIR